MSRDPNTVGVVVARFQVPDLHEGHRFTVQHALDRHEDVLVILGATYAPTDRNPLSFAMREAMVRSAFPDPRLAVERSDSLPSSREARSHAIDEIIARRFPNRPAIIYGARDSIAQRYRGSHPTSEVPTITSTSATKVREAIVPIDSPEFRAGVIHAAMSRPPVFYPAADVAVLDDARCRVALVAKREEEGKLRFPGVWFRPDEDASLEAAAARCLRKELPGITISRDPRMLGSARIEDWRFRRTRDGVITTLFLAYRAAGEPTPGAGVDAARWVGLASLLESVVPEHRVLANLLLQNL
jgi:bifunctional NMN adenylyltransferase/nudix hydrolase